MYTATYSVGKDTYVRRARDLATLMELLGRIYLEDDCGDLLRDHGAGINIHVRKVEVTA